MRTLPTSRRLAVCGLTALAGLLLLASAGRATADEGVARVTDQKTGVVGASHSEPCVIEMAPQRVSSHGRHCGPGCQCGTNCHCSGAAGQGCCNDQAAGCTSGRCGQGGSACGKGGCANGLCGNGACGNGSCCACGNACDCGGCGSGLSKLFGGKSSKNCRCGSHCQCSKKGGLCGLGLGRCNPCCDLNGDGYADPIGNGICHGCGAHGPLFGHGYCGSCCGGVGGCLPGVPCLGAGLGIPCLGGCFGVPGGCFGRLAGAGTRPRGALGGHYSRVYAVNPYYHDFRDGAVYAAQGYNAPMAVPLAPNVDYQFNYGWGIPSSRITPISRVVPSPYAVQPQYAVPYGYVPAGGVPSDVTTESSTEANAEEASR